MFKLLKHAICAAVSNDIIFFYKNDNDNDNSNNDNNINNYNNNNNNNSSIHGSIHFSVITFQEF